MLFDERETMHDAAAIIEHALHAIGSHTPVQVIDHGTALLVGTFADNLTIRHQGQSWNVIEHTPYWECTHCYSSLLECAHDVAMCDDHAVVFDHTEERIDAAIRQALLN